MYTLRSLLLVLLFSAAFLLPAETFSQPVQATVTGSGQMTGHIATVRLKNESTGTAEVFLAPALIPAIDSTQGYVVPGVYLIKLRPGQDTAVQLMGYCTDPNRPPADSGQVLTDPKYWGLEYLSRHFVPGDPLLLVRGFRPLPDTVPYYFTFPGTSDTVNAQLDFDRYPGSGANLVVDAARAIEQAYDSLYQAGSIQTPYAAWPERQRNAVIQQALWHALGALRGIPYQLPEFQAALYRQYAREAGREPDTFSDTVREQLTQDVQQFWTAFEVVCRAAQVTLEP
ncbi:MAG: hypothetical protein EP344_15035 [Bacteroidetes bacterium]|nr:MAG: hypothetical protein EP344_15035 [Bacteroidota bacterium]